MSTKRMYTITYVVICFTCFMAGLALYFTWHAYTHGSLSETAHHGMIFLLMLVCAITLFVNLKTMRMILVQEKRIVDWNATAKSWISKCEKKYEHDLPGDDSSQ